MRHQDLTINHRLESWVYANAAARTGATGFVAGDVGRIAYQTDTGQYWRLTAITPTWALIGPPITVPAPVYARLQTAQETTPGTVSPSAVMAAVGGPITPSASGKLLVTFCGSMSNNASNLGVAVQIRFGTGTAPAHGAGATGTPIGPTPLGQSYLAGALHAFSVSAVITGLTVGTPYWIDLSYYNGGGGGTATLTNTACSAVEIP